MDKETETRHIRTGMGLISSSQSRRIFVQRSHGSDRQFIISFPYILHPGSRTYDTDSQRLCEDQAVTWTAVLIGQYFIRMDHTGDRKTIFDIRILNGMTTCQDSSCLFHFFRSPGKDLSQNVEIHTLRKTDNIEGCFRRAAHGINVTQSIGRGDLSKYIGILYHRRKEIQRLYDSQIIRQPVDGRIICMVVPYQKILVLLSRKHR